MAKQDATYIIIGNGVAGTTAAETIRKQDPNGTVVLITNEPHTLYNRVALPPYLRLETPREKVFIRNLEWHERNGIQLLLETHVSSVNHEERTVTTADGREFRYDKLLVATGGRPNRLKALGAEGVQGVFNFQYLDDADAISEHIRRSRCAVAVGGSFIAYELTEAFNARGLHTTWLIRGPRFLRRIIDDAGGELVDLVARSHGVETVYGEEVAEVLRKDGAVKGVVTTGGKHLDADLVGCGLGLTYNLELLANTPVEVNRGVVTNEYLETTVPGIFAAGDVAEYYDVTIGRHNIMGTWSSAASQGRTAGMNMVGAGVQYANVPLYTSMLFDLKLSAFGLTPESEPKLESVTKADLASRRYRRLFFLENRLVGGIIIGDNQEMKGRSKLMELIKSGCPVDDREALLHV